MNKIKIIIYISIIVIFLIVIGISLLIDINPFKTSEFTRDIISADISEPISTEPQELIKSSSLVDVQYIHSGNLKVKLSNPLNIKHPACKGMEDKDITVPTFAYLLHHEKYGYFLIDSGCESAYADNPYGSMKGSLVSKFVPETEMESQDAIDKQLSEDVLNNLNAVFFTHLHFDHTSGLTALPENTTYIAGKGEKFFYINGLLESDHFKKSDTVYMIDFNSEIAKDSDLGKAVDIFGDQTVWAISTPGHSKGHISYLINGNDGPVLITGDACCLNKSLETGAGPGTSCGDIKLAQETLDKICAFVEKNSDMKVWCGHDYPEDNSESDNN